MSSASLHIPQLFPIAVFLQFSVLNADATDESLAKFINIKIRCERVMRQNALVSCHVWQMRQPEMTLIIIIVFIQYSEDKWTIVHRATSLWNFIVYKKKLLFFLVFNDNYFDLSFKFRFHHKKKWYFFVCWKRIFCVNCHIEG